MTAESRPGAASAREERQRKISRDLFRITH
jgi:hypothetical protein